MDPSLLDLIALDQELSSRSLAEFIHLAWPVLEPATELRWGWAMDAICDHLEAVSRGELRRLLINCPPGCSKSLTSAVFFPAWLWGPKNRPGHRVIGSSYSETYATRDCRRQRDLVSSDWYQERWGDLVELDREAERSFSNKRMGWRESIPFCRLTGGRADLLVIDDPHSTEEAESQADRDRACRIFSESVPTRLVDPATSAIVVIMQRLHVADVSSLAIEQGYTHLCLPMEFEPDRKCLTSIGFEDPRTEEDELLFSERFPREVVDRDKEILGSHAVAGQFQQRPSPRGGGIIKEAWFAHRYRQRGAPPLSVVLALDCASKPRERNDPSAAGVWAEFTDHFELWHVDVGRREFPALVRWVKDLACAWDPTAIVIEDKDAGQQLIQQLKADTKLPVLAFQPGALDKLTRMDAESPTIEAGRVWLPEEAPWVSDYVAELTTVPHAPHDDRFDMTSMALRWFRTRKKKRTFNSGVASVNKPSAKF